MNTDFISAEKTNETHRTMWDKISTNSNKFGIVLFYGLAMTNDQDINYAALREVNVEQFQHAISPSAEGFAEPQNKALSLFTDKHLSEEQVILEFANKLLSLSEDIDPEISKVVQKRFWDMI